MSLLPHIANRVTVQQFNGDAVSQESLDTILEAGRRAPSAKNRQPWRFVIVRDKTVLSRLEDAAYGASQISTAPVVIAACSTNVDYRMPNGQHAYPIDIATAVSFMMLQAQEEGIGSAVLTTFDEVIVKEILSVPYQMRVVVLLSLGYPEQIPLQRERQDLKKITSYDHW